MEHQGKHNTFLDLDITIEDSVLVYKLFEKRDKFTFFFYCSHTFIISILLLYPIILSSDILSSFLYGSVFSEFLRIARRTLRLPDFILHASELCLRMIVEGRNKNKISQQIKIVFHRNPKILNVIQKSYAKIIELIKTEKNIPNLRKSLMLPCISLFNKLR